MNTCNHTTSPRIGYLASFMVAELRMKRGEKQRQCPVCGRWIWERDFVRLGVGSRHASETPRRISGSRINSRNSDKTRPEPLPAKSERRHGGSSDPQAHTDNGEKCPNALPAPTESDSSGE